MKRLLLTLIALFLTTSAFAQQSDRDRGIDLYREGKYAEAAKVLTAMLSTDPNDRLLIKYLGASQANLGKEKDAAKTFREFKESTGLGPARPDVEITYIAKPVVEYTTQGRQESIEGHVLLAVEFKADGTIGFTIPVEKLGYGLTVNSMKAARKIKFSPAMKDGKPVTSVHFVQYAFSLR